jgi:ribonuclease HI
MKVTIYTDGSARGNPGPGGYGIVMMSDRGHAKELSAGYRHTTNNRMELLSVIVALETIKNPNEVEVTVVSDSKYVVDAISKGWLKNWVAKGFKDKKNPDLWQRYLKLKKPPRLDFQWVKGHAGNIHNERCDRLAVAAATKTNLPPDEGYEASIEGGKGMF